MESEAPRTLPPFVVPRALAVTAGMTWRILVIGLGIYILIWALFQIAPVALAIFLALFVTALAGPVARLIQRVLPKVVSVVLALLLITVVGGVIIFSVLRSIIEQGPALASAITAGIQDVEDWLQQGPLQLTGDQLNSVQQQAETWRRGVDCLRSAVGPRRGRHHHHGRVCVLVRDRVLHGLRAVDLAVAGRLGAGSGA